MQAPPPNAANESLVADTMKQIAGWVGVTLLCLAVTFLGARPQHCLEAKECSAILNGGITKVNTYASVALGVALLIQFMTTKILYIKTRGMVGIVRDIEYTFVPPLLMCLAFFMLLVENLMLYKLSFVHVAAEGVGSHHRPIYSPILLEWCVNVPILLILSGNSALNRPISEVSRPLIVTNIYMIIAWSAYFVPNEIIRWVFITVAFLMYAWASYDMANWILIFRATARKDFPARNLRCALTIGLILVFFVYGMVYLAGLLDLINPRHELIFWVTANVAVKLFFLILFVGIRASQFYDLLVTLVKLKVLPLDQLMPHDFEQLQGGADEPLMD